MTENSEKEDKSLFLDRDNYLLSLLNKESGSITESLGIIEKISKKHKLSFNQIAELIENKEKYVSLPVGLFRSSLSPLEAVVRYLRDISEYSFSKISKMLSRDETTVWTTYNNSKHKSEKVILDLEMNDIDFKKIKVKKEDLFVPLSIFSQRGLSILESLCVYLRETFGLNYHNIGMLLGKDERTVWTVVNRAKRKLL